MSDVNPERHWSGAVTIRPEYCEAVDEQTPCICGATVEGKDPVRGICQARRSGPKPTPLLEFVLVHKDTGDGNIELDGPTGNRYPFSENGGSL